MANRFNKSEQIENEEKPLVEGQPLVKGIKQGGEAGEFKQVDHSHGPKTDKLLDSKGFKDIAKT